MKEVKLIQADFREYDRRVNELLARGWELDGAPHVVAKDNGEPKSVIQLLRRERVQAAPPEKKENI